jgi:branched-chain amino acid transport system permease protein
MNGINSRRGLLIAAVTALLVIPFVMDDTFILRILTEAIMWIGLAIAFDVIAGYTGYLNFGHGAFFGLGAYTIGILMMQANWPFALALPIGGCVAALVALIAGFPTLRLKGAYFAIATWALSRAIQQLALNMDITGGPDGMRLEAFLNPVLFYYLMFGAVGITFLVLWYLLECAPSGSSSRRSVRTKRGPKPSDSIPPN